MESRTPVNILTGVRMDDSRVAGYVPYVNNTTGVLHGHHFHSTVTDLQTPVYRSAPKGTRTAVWTLRCPLLSLIARYSDRSDSNGGNKEVLNHRESFLTIFAK